MSDRATQLEAFVDRFEIDADGAVAGGASHDGAADASADARDATPPAPAATESASQATRLVQSTEPGEAVGTDTDVYDESAADGGPERLEPGDI